MCDFVQEVLTADWNLQDGLGIILFPECPNKKTLSKSQIHVMTRDG